MKTRDLLEADGCLTGFRVSNTLIGRHGLTRFVASIPGVEVVRRQRRFALTCREDFCEFILDGERFLAIEPFGDNTEFWIVNEPPRNSAALLKVRLAFQARRWRPW